MSSSGFPFFVLSASAARRRAASRSFDNVILVETPDNSGRVVLACDDRRGGWYWCADCQQALGAR
ncbi:MAG TPA: hypothetical protein VH593_34005 [Ktedonobacteraceae bacterium]